MVTALMHAQYVCIPLLTSINNLQDTCVFPSSQKSTHSGKVCITMIITIAVNCLNVNMSLIVMYVHGWMEGQYKFSMNCQPTSA